LTNRQMGIKIEFNVRIVLIVRIILIRKALRHKYIITSSLEVPILGYGNVTVQVIKLDKSKGILYLKDVAFYMDFNTNLLLFYLL
jgi:hypothetical protein